MKVVPVMIKIFIGILISISFMEVSRGVRTGFIVGVLQGFLRVLRKFCGGFLVFCRGYVWVSLEFCRAFVRFCRSFMAVILDGNYIGFVGICPSFLGLYTYIQHYSLNNYLNVVCIYRFVMIRLFITRRKVTASTRLDLVPVFSCVHDQFPCVFQHLSNKYFLCKWPPSPLTAILSSLLFNNNITTSAFSYKDTLP